MGYFGNIIGLLERCGGEMRTGTRAETKIIDNNQTFTSLNKRDGNNIDIRRAINEYDPSRNAIRSKYIAPHNTYKMMR